MTNKEEEVFKILRPAFKTAAELLDTIEFADDQEAQLVEVAVAITKALFTLNKEEK